MTVSHEDIGEVVRSLFANKPVVDEEFVRFSLENDYYKAEVVLTLFDTDPDATFDQGLQIWIWFCDYSDKHLNFGNLSWSDVKEYCFRFQGELDWGTLIPYREENGAIDIALFRSIDTTPKDIQLALEEDLSSEFLRMLKRLASEWDRLSYIFDGIITGQITSTENVEMFTFDSAGHTYKPHNEPYRKEVSCAVCCFK